MSTDEYVPGPNFARQRYVLARTYLREAGTMTAATAEFDRFLARVRRDAAREALDGLAEDVLSEWNMQHRWIVKPIDEYRDTHYPETED